MDQSVDRVRHTLESARTEINRQRPQIAEQLLKPLREDPQVLEDPLLSAEYKLVLAEILAARLDPGAESLFEEAIQTLAHLSAAVTLRIRASEHYGDYLTAQHHASIARRHYEIARRLAVDSRFEEDGARIQLKFVRMDLELDRDPQLENYRTLKRVADRLGSTCAQQLSAWIQHAGMLQAMGKGLRFARNRDLASEAYFENLLQSVNA